MFSLNIRKTFEPIKLYLTVLLICCGVLLTGTLLLNRVMDKRLEQFTRLQSRYYIISNVSLIISKNISSMQGSFQHLLLASSPGDLKVAEERIDESSKRVRRALEFLEKGGSFRDDFKVNFENEDNIAFSFTMDSPPDDVVLASMELRTSLSLLDDMVVEYSQFAWNTINGEQRDKGSMVLMHKKLAPFFQRMEEHSNRFYIQSSRSLEESRRARNNERRQILILILSSSVLTIGMIVVIGIMVMRSASNVLTERQDAQKKLVQMNEQLEERIKLRTAALVNSEKRLRDVALTSGDIIWQFDDRGFFSYVSGNTEQLLNVQEEEMIGLCFEDMRYPSLEGSEALSGLSLRFQARKPIVDFVFPMVVRGGEEKVSLLINAIPIYEGETFQGYFGVAKDISEKREYEKRLRLFEKLFATSQEGITITDVEGNIILVNPAFTSITGYSAEEAIGKNPRILKSEHHTKEFYTTMWKSLTEDGLWTGEIWNRRKSGEAYPEWLSLTSVTNRRGDVQNYVGVFHDITAMKQKEDEIMHMAYYDSLTGLPNRTMLLEQFGIALMAAETDFQRHAVLFIDLDNFKIINDSLGHEAGDEILKAVAQRFKKLVRSNDLVARLGGDEFVFLLSLGKDDSLDPVTFAERIIASMEKPVQVKNQDFFVTPSIGIAMYPDDGDTPEALLKHADLAMYSAKETGKNQSVQFTNEMIERASARLVMENKLRQALVQNEIYPLFQPKVLLDDGCVIGSEALARWFHQGEIISPAEFIPVAEETGLILQLGETIMQQSCQAVRSIIDDIGVTTKVAVNVSAKQFYQEDFVSRVKEIVLQADIPFSCLELEITESLLLDDVSVVTEKLEELEVLGITISIDDFGTGYSSLSYLNQLPIHRLKIDQSFVADLHSEDKNDGVPLLQAIIQMGKSLRMHVLAEGIETIEEKRLLADLGCEEGQGYYFARPLSLEKFKQFLVNNLLD